MVNVTKENFIEQSNDLIRHLPSAAFVAVDEEMTGISVTRGRPRKDQTPSQRWPELKQAPERYSVIQLGVALFHSYTQPPAPVATIVAATDNHSIPEEESSCKKTASSSSGRGYTSAPPPPDSEIASMNGVTYTVRRYNFYMFPSSSSNNNNSDNKEVVMNPATVAFLNQHKMSFDVWTKRGIAYATSATAASTAVREYLEHEQKLRATETRTAPPNVRRMELKRPFDIDFMARAMASVREWLDAPHPAEEDANETNSNDDEDDGEIGVAPASTGTSLLLPPCNSFLRRALYEAMDAEYPALELENGGNNQIRVWRLNAQEKLIRRDRLRRERWGKLVGETLGMWRIFDALSRACRGLPLNPSSIVYGESYDDIDWSSVGQVEESEVTGISTKLVTSAPKMIPLIVHNGFMDLCFLLTHFHASILPTQYQDVKNLVSSYFPIIYDTKVMATECNCWGNDGDQNSASTTLSNLFQSTVKVPIHPECPAVLDELRVIQTAGRAEAVHADVEHEAAFDAYMTGAIFLALTRRIQHIGGTRMPSNNNMWSVMASRHSYEGRMWYARNKIYQFSMYTMDLEETKPNRDPMSKGMLPESTYRVSGFDKAVTTRDIVRCLSGLEDDTNRRINFDIVWIDDTTFLVAAVIRNAELEYMSSLGELGLTLRKHGGIIKEALSGGFNQNESIVELEEFLRTANNEIAIQKKTSLADRFLSIFGLETKKDRAGEEMSDQRASKRRRVV